MPRRIGEDQALGLNRLRGYDSRADDGARARADGRRDRLSTLLILEKAYPCSQVGDLALEGVDGQLLSAGAITRLDAPAADLIL